MGKECSGQWYTAGVLFSLSLSSSSLQTAFLVGVKQCSSPQMRHRKKRCSGQRKTTYIAAAASSSYISLSFCIGLLSLHRLSLTRLSLSLISSLWSLFIIKRKTENSSGRWTASPFISQSPPSPSPSLSLSLSFHLSLSL